MSLLRDVVFEQPGQYTFHLLDVSSNAGRPGTANNPSQQSGYADTNSDGIGYVIQLARRQFAQFVKEAGFRD